MKIEKEQKFPKRSFCFTFVLVSFECMKNQNTEWQREAQRDRRKTAADDNEMEMANQDNIV